MLTLGSDSQMQGHSLVKIRNIADSERVVRSSAYGAPAIWKFGVDYVELVNTHANSAGVALGCAMLWSNQQNQKLANPALQVATAENPSSRNTNNVSKELISA